VSFRHLKPGDRVTRMLAGTLPMEMQVTQNEDGVITCAAVEGDVLIHAGWTFNADNGGEIDADLGWDPPRTPTGSILQLKEKTE
jgi:hypothetical protein